METGADPRPLPDFLAAMDLPRVPRQERSRRKRDALLAAAAHLFEERGYDATTADDIAQRAGVSIGTFYSYFRNKRQAFLTLYAACIEEYLALRIPEIDFISDPRRVLYETVRRSLQRDPLFYGLRRALFELLPRDPELAEFNQQMTRLIYEQTLVVTRKIAAAGLARDGLDVEGVCWMLTLLLNRAWESLPGPKEAPPEELERHYQALTHIVYHAVIRDAGN